MPAEANYDTEPVRYDPEQYVEAVLALVERIPSGRVMSYGAIAECLYPRFGRGSPRRVGTIMARYGGAVPWYRVVTGGGRLPAGHEVEARRRLEAEGVVLTGPRVLMARYAWMPDRRRDARDAGLTVTPGCSTDRGRRPTSGR